MYLCAIYYNKSNKKLGSSKITEDEKENIEENLKFIKNKHILLVNALTYNSNCSHLALIKLVKAVVDVTEYSVEEEKYDDFKQAMKKK